MTRVSDETLRSLVDNTFEGYRIPGGVTGMARELLALRAEVDKWRDLRNTAVKYGDRVTAENIALRAKVAEQEAMLAAAHEVVGRWRSEDFACGIYAGCHCYEVGSDDPCASCAVVEWIERYDETTGGGDE